MTKVFILNRDRLHSPKEMVEFLWTIPDVEPIIIDNASTNPELLSYYETKPCHIERMKLNWKECVLFQTETGLMDKYNLYAGGYCMTDSDLLISHLPKDFIEVLFEGLRRYPEREKVGLSLSLENLAETPIKAEIIQHESHFWNNKIDEQYYDSWCDTTFCAMKNQIHSFNSLRTTPPYVAIHRPWTYTKETLPEDERYYMQNALPTHWTTKMKEYFGI